MIRVSVLYPAGEGTTFDIDYYKTTHMDIVKRTMKPVRAEVDQPVDGPYIGVGHLYFETMEDLAAAVGNQEPMEDIPNFTNATPVMQVSEILD